MRPTPELSAVVPPELDGSRLDLAVARLWPDLTRSQAARLVAAGDARLNGRAVRSSERVRAGDRVEVTPTAPEPTSLAAESIPLRILHRDDALLVVDKPAGLVVHPAPGHPSGTLVNALLGFDPDLSIGGGQRPGIVHRLDRDTSGLLVVARTDAALNGLQRQWADRTVLKLYLALVRGHPRLDHAIVDAPIGRDPRDRKRMAVEARGRAATTEYRVRERLPGSALVEARIDTGRTHQIRVHLASIGHPIVGDPVYGSAEPGLGRQFLHAARLGFHHPADGRWVEFESPLPDDLRSYLARLR